MVGSMWNLNSRIHQLRSFPKQCFVKRDDELSCTISGTKLRKYSSLVPVWIEQGIKHLIVIAGPQSNNLLAAVQIARELGISLTAFLIKPWQEEMKGNYKFSRMFLDERDIIWVERQDWSQVESLAQAYARQLKEKSYLLKEGGSVADAMAGAMTLGDDILRNEKELGLHFDHIFIDAGTGFSAAALIKSLQEHQHSGTLHVLLLADNKEIFADKLLQWTAIKSARHQVFLPTTAKAFGAVNQTIKNEIRTVAKEEGFLLDPIYSAKLFYEARKKIIEDKLEGNKLMIHSGGALTLAGFDW